MILEELVKFGLSTKEAQVYLSLLELGTIPVSLVAKKAGINRSTTYVILDQLSKNGLVSIAEESGIKLYTASSPDKLISIAESAIKKFSDLALVARRIQPELRSLYVGVGPKPKVQFYEGLEGIRSVLEDTLTSKETIRAFASIENIHVILPDYFPDYYQRRTQKKISIKTIFPNTEFCVRRTQRDKEEARESILVSADQFGFTPEINIYDDKVVFMSLKEKFALIIKSEEIADALKKVFDLSYSEAKCIQKTEM